MTARGPRALLVLLVLVVLTAGAATAQNGGERLQVDVRRVRVSLGFSGQKVFIFGHVPEGTRRVVTVIEAPGRGPVRLMEKGRVGPFWLGVRQYAVSGLPGLYLVELSCPGGNVLRECPEEDPLGAANRELAAVGVMVGPEAIVSRASVEVLQGGGGARDLERLLDGLWELESSLGLWGVDPNRIRLNDEGMYYFEARLPAHAPEGKYTITSWFLGLPAGPRSASSELFVRRWGLVAWLSRLAARHPWIYALITVGIALAAGWLAGAVFRRRTDH